MNARQREMFRSLIDYVQRETAEVDKVLGTLEYADKSYTKGYNKGKEEVLDIIRDKVGIEVPPTGTIPSFLRSEEEDNEATEDD